LTVRLTPRADRTAVEGVFIGPDRRPALQLRLPAPPVDGAANKALAAWLAKALGVRKSDIRLVAGAKSRVKVLEIASDPPRLLALLETWT
jgi:uncharacterized protein